MKKCICIISAGCPVVILCLRFNNHHLGTESVLDFYIFVQVAANNITENIM